MNFDELCVRLDDDRFEGQSSVADVGRVCRVCFGMHLKPKLGWGDKAPASASKGACGDDVMFSDASEGYSGRCACACGYVCLILARHPPIGLGPPHSRGFWTTHTKRLITVGRTPLDD